MICYSINLLNRNILIALLKIERQPRSHHQHVTIERMERDDTLSG